MVKGGNWRPRVEDQLESNHTLSHRFGILHFVCCRAYGRISKTQTSVTGSARGLRRDEQRSFSGERVQLQLWRFLQRVWADHYGLLAVLCVSGLAFGNSRQQQSTGNWTIGLGFHGCSSSVAGPQLEVFLGGAGDAFSDRGGLPWLGGMVGGGRRGRRKAVRDS